MLDAPEQSSRECKPAEKLGLDFRSDFHLCGPHGRRAWTMSCLIWPIGFAPSQA